MGVALSGRLVPIDDTALFVEERGYGYPIIILHGGPGLDHHEFADYLDPLADDFRLLLTDMRACGRSELAPQHTWTLERHAQDVIMLARSLGLARYAVLGHSYGAFVALQQAVDFPGMAAQTIVSSGVPSSRWLKGVERELESFEPEELRTQVAESWAREADLATAEEFAQLMRDQLPFHFADPRDPRIQDYLVRTEDAIYAPEVLRRFADAAYGGIELVDRLGEVASATLILAGRHDRACPAAASRHIAAGIPGAELIEFEHSAHMTFVEEPDLYVAVVRSFLQRTM
jgi:proline iminopeptidase